MSYGEHASQEGTSAVRTVISTIVYVAVILVAVWALKAFVISPYTIPSGSMCDTIVEGDCVWSEKVTYYMSDPEAGDIITFNDPLNADRTLIKRIIATEGQTVELKDGYVYVDGAKLDEPYTEGKASLEETPAAGVEVSYPYTVPEGYVWVMGDNRTNSSDSRYFGAIPVSSITGRAIAIYWPLDHIGAL